MSGSCPRCGSPTWQLGNEDVCTARDCRYQRERLQPANGREHRLDAVSGEQAGDGDG